jgi:hypothetical protein
MSSEINNKFISSDKQSFSQQINEQMMNNNENDNKINETLSKVLVKDIMNEENKSLIEKLREENENLREIIRLCLLLIGLCGCRNTNNVNKRNQINLLLNNLNNNNSNQSTNCCHKEFRLLAVNQVIGFDGNKRSLDKDLSEEQISCDAEEAEAMSSSDDDWFDDNSDQDWTEDQTNDPLIGDCLKSKSDIKCKKSSVGKTREKSLKPKTNAEIKTNNSINSYNNSICRPIKGFDKNEHNLRSRLKSVGVRKRGRIKLVRDPNAINVCDWPGCGKVFKSFVSVLSFQILMTIAFMFS